MAEAWATRTLDGRVGLVRGPVEPGCCAGLEVAVVDPAANWSSLEGQQGCERDAHGVLQGQFAAGRINVGSFNPIGRSTTEPLEPHEETVMSAALVFSAGPWVGVEPAVARQSLAHAFGARSVEAMAGVPGTDTRWEFAVSPKGESPFSVYETAGQIGTDGTPEQCARVLAALRQGLPIGPDRLIAITPDASRFVELPAGVTAQQVLDGWQDVDDTTFEGFEE